jgi:hypothetical protein
MRYLQPDPCLELIGGRETKGHTHANDAHSILLIKKEDRVRGYHVWPRAAGA